MCEGFFRRDTYTCEHCLRQPLLSGSLTGALRRSLRVEYQILALQAATRVGTYYPFAEEHFCGNLKCGVTSQVGAHDHKFEMCADEYPYYVQDLADEFHCSFVCDCNWVRK